MNKINSYKALVFDCDGVILNSNEVKTAAFYKAVLPYGEVAARQFVEYHRANGGISRFKKFSYFIEHIAADTGGPSHSEMLDTYADHVREGLLTCDIAPGLHELREAYSDLDWFVVSGGAQAELRDVFALRGLAALFNKGIYGSPDTKEHILGKLKAEGELQLPSLFIGDSKYDYEASKSSGLDFIFMTGWTEFDDWPSWAESNNIETKNSIQAILTE